jgi:hypothetical protein
VTTEVPEDAAEPEQPADPVVESLELELEHLKPRIKHRSKALSTLLVVKGGFGLVMLFVALAALSAMTPQRMARLPHETLAQVLALRDKLILTFITTVIDLIGVTGTWMFKRWGVFVLACASVFLLFLRIMQRETLLAVAGVAVAGSVVAALFPKWHDYD